MRVKMCVTNLDFYAKGTCEKEILKQLIPEKKELIDRGQYEFKEVHCLGYCHWCQSGPKAVVDGQLVYKQYNND